MAIEAERFNLSWEYVGEELAIFWVSPYTHQKEKIASFWWPTHPPEATEEVEGIFESIAQRIMAKPSKEKHWTDDICDNSRDCPHCAEERAAQEKGGEL